MTEPASPAAALFERAQAAHAAGDIAGGLALARQAIAIDPTHAAALEHVATVLVTRRGRYQEGIDMLEQAVAGRPNDPGLLYALGWCCEFAAHEIARRAKGEQDPLELYARAADAFRRCLALHPEGKLADDAADLLEFVEHQLVDR